MAKGTGFGRGVLHGGLLGAATIAALSLVLPQPERGGDPAAVAATQTDPGAAVPSTPGEAPSVRMPEAPAVSPDAARVTDDISVGNTSMPDSSPTAPVSPGPEPQDTDAASVPEIAETPEPDAAEPQPSEPQPTGPDEATTSLRPPPGSEFARAEDVPPTIPGQSEAPLSGSDAVALPFDAPAVEPPPDPSTETALQPDPLTGAEPPQPADAEVTVPVTPSADADAPAGVAAPERIGTPRQDTGPMPESRAAPVPPAQAEPGVTVPETDRGPETATPTRPAAPDAPGATPPAMQDDPSAPVSQTGTAETAAAPVPETAQVPLPQEAAQPSRDAPPALSTPDNQREEVPEPPGASEDADMPAETPSAGAAGPASEAVSPLQSGPDLSVPALPSLGDL
ncbi:hypothetical protein [Paracoccus sp. SCSIO 75233]|uniref:hypothetical protein n=1 Tax=Paracoccus sp. SCSIO 75233 TaxID=3017782 RepID=UPI0022F14254|nr:hypothetical protein [Paracoccus sp. SCSIO 75233]WBU54251.1 hypothetical protein PAF12_05305 [Paracoccus sp. SCSIO 75233]